jgi:hypothetical protein
MIVFEVSRLNEPLARILMWAGSDSSNVGPQLVLTFHLVRETKPLRTLSSTAKP